MIESPPQLFNRLAIGAPSHAPSLDLLDQSLINVFGSAFDVCDCVDAFVETHSNTVLVECALVCAPLVLEIPGFGGFSVTAGHEDDSELELALTIDFVGATFLLFDTPVYVRCLDSALLTPVVKVNDQWEPELDGDGSVKKFGFIFSGIDFKIDANGISDATTAIGIDVPPVRIGNSGVVVEMIGLSPCLSSQATLPLGVPSGSRGVAISSVIVHLPDSLKGSFAPSDIVGEGLFLGTGGFTGKLSAEWLNGTTIQLGGFECTLQSLLLNFKQNSLIESLLECEMTLPFFDHPVDVEVGLVNNGDFTVAIGSVNGLTTLSVPNVLDFELDSLGFDIKDGEFTVRLSGRLTPTFGDFNWPTFDVKELAIDSEGHVKLTGGWLDLPKQYSLDFNGFKVEITRFGFGRNDDGTKWVGMSGGVELVKGLPAGASVEGLRITAEEDWSNPRISFDGVGVELRIPEVLYFKGGVSYREFPDPDAPLTMVQRFEGDIKLKLEAIDLEIDGILVAGSASGYNFFAIYLNVELPTGIPLGPTGVGIFGLSGLMAIQMGPDKLPAEKWYGVGPTDGWYKKPPLGIEKLSKWKNVQGARAFGAGVTIGTFSDNGFTFNGRVLLVLVLPGPTILLQGRANLLKERAKLGDEAMFRTLAVLDKQAGSLLFGVDATYQYDENTGGLIQISGGLEAYYSFNDPSAWHLYLGLKDPRESRIQAKVLSLFDANAYFMLDAHRLAMGAWIGYQKSWQFSKLSVALEAWMENNAVVSFKPAHLYGDLWMHGSVTLRVFRFGVGLNVDARLAADVFKPFHLLGELTVSIDLPRPLKDISAHLSLEWGPNPDAPPKPIVLKDVAIEHLKSSVKWPLPAGALVLPSYDDNGSGFLLPSAVGPGDGPPPPSLPRVPMDSRPSISFARNVWDEALVGIVAQPLVPEWERIGDPAGDRGPARARYALKAVHLEKYNSTVWTNVASADGGTGANPPLFGAWSATAAIGGSGTAQNKLLLWSKSGLDQFRHSSADWITQFSELFPEWPCFPPPPPSRVCLNFAMLNKAAAYPSPFAHPNNPNVVIEIAGTAAAAGRGFRAHTPPASLSGSYWQVVCPFSPNGVVIRFATPAQDVSITATAQSADPIEVHVEDAAGNTFGPYALTDHVIAIPVPDVVLVRLENGGSVCLAEICALLPPSQQLLDAYAAMVAHNTGATSLWSGTGNVLEPFTPYRLRIETSVQTSDFPYSSAYNTTLFQTQYAYFETAGPPGIGALSVPANAAGQDFDSGLDDLTRYVEQTIPATVAAPGQKPLSPRPVYRGYDVGVVFNENYVSLMYKMAGRDLNLFLYDRNNLPARDASGRLRVDENPWDTKPAVTLSASDQLWISTFNSNTCSLQVNAQGIPPDETLATRGDLPLDPDMLYEARLMPSLFHEDFGRFAAGDQAQGSGANIGRWQVADDSGAIGGPSLWSIAIDQNSGAKRILQTQTLALTFSGANLVAEGARLILNANAALASADKSQPAQWTDYRVSLYLRSAGGGPLGAAFRRAGPTHYYLFLMDATVPCRRLVRVQAGVETELAQDGFAYASNHDYHLVIEALGDSLRVYLDDELVFDVKDSAFSQGGMALYCSGAAGSAFSEIQVHDFSDNAVPAYKFNFTTSPFVDFFHHLHSFDDGCWASASAMSPADFNALLQESVPNPSDPVTDEEARAFESLAADVLGQSAFKATDRVEIQKIERAGAIAGLLVRGPQPFGFARNTYELLRSSLDTPTALSPFSAKLVGAILGALSPAGETLSILLRESVDLSGYRIEMRDVLPLEDLDGPASQWNALFLFPPTEAGPAGTRVIVYSCSPDDAPPAQPGGLQYFRAASGDPGFVALLESAVDLRLVAPGGEVVHARRFLRDDAYLPFANVRLLRKKDETALAILPAPGQSFAAGSYRLHLQYRRDNTANDPASIILTAAGDPSPETVTLDFAWNPFQ